MTRPPHIVMVGWRGPDHPKGGGAETFTRLALEGLVERGAKVTWLTSSPGGDGVADWNGIQVVRVGEGLGQVVAAGRWLSSHGRGVDMVIDQINGYPMFTPLTFHGLRMVLIHQLVRGVWFEHLPWPLAAAGWILEPVWMAWYRRHPTLTVSSDTARDLRRLGFRDVTIVRNAVERPEGLPTSEREPPSPPHFVALGRLVPGKRFEEAIAAFVLLRRFHPDARFTLMGRGEGPYVRHLGERIAGVPGAQLVANPNERDKWRLLCSASALLATSVREGWGIAVSEAHAAGTPVVAYDVAGLRESTRHQVDGLVCPPTPAAAAESMRMVVEDADIWRAMSRHGRERVSRLTPARLQEEFAAAVQRLLVDGGKATLSGGRASKR